MRERWIQKVALGVLILGSAFVGNRGVVNQENSQSANIDARSVTLNPPTEGDKIRSLFAEIVDLATPTDFGGNNFPRASRFD